MLTRRRTTRPAGRPVARPVARPVRPVARAVDAHRGPLRLVLAALLAVALGALTIAPAQAAAYRFWAFYQLTDGAWAFAQKGSDQTVPADGSVEGWRFAVSDTTETRFPRAVLTFDQICGATPAQDGSKRVGIVIDYGRAADSADESAPPDPKATCAVVSPESSSTEALREAAGDLRSEKGLLCAVSGYPATGCGAEVGTVSEEAKAADTPVTISASTAGATTTPAAADATPAAAAPTTSADASSGTNTAAYVIAGLALLALIAYLVVRARRAAAARHDA